MAHNDLGNFLRARRAGLSPDDTGIPTYGSTRRVPGLRREEVALMAGVSANYYARLEQGESHHLSDSVFEAVAAALRLDQHERRHFARLAWPGQLTRNDPGPEKVRGSLQALVAGNTEQAASIVGRRTDLLGANRLYRALYGFRPGQVVNLALRLFLEPAMRDLLVNWENVANEAVRCVRDATGEQPDDPQLAALIGELSIKSPDFVRLWAGHSVAECADTLHEFNHPQVGRMTLTGETLRVPDGPGQRITFLAAAPDSDSADRLRTLASLAA